MALALTALLAAGACTATAVAADRSSPTRRPRDRRSSAATPRPTPAQPDPHPRRAAARRRPPRPADRVVVLHRPPGGSAGLRRGPTRRFGFEFVIFRAERGTFPTTWASHLAITDETGDRFLYAQRLEVGAQVDRSPRSDGRRGRRLRPEPVGHRPDRSRDLRPTGLDDDRGRRHRPPGGGPVGRRGRGGRRAARPGARR